MTEASKEEVALPAERIKDRQGLKYICFDILEKTRIVEHAFTTRIGGVSKGHCSSLNMAFQVGDNPEAVLSNRRKVLNMLSFELEDMVCGQQVHGIGVCRVGKADRGKGAYRYQDGIPKTDAIITDVPGVVLASFYADCVPIFLLDPTNRAVGLVHAGWRGSMAKIVQIAVMAMSDAFTTKTEDCLAVIGPSIRSCCYEVDEPVLARMSAQGVKSEHYIKPGRQEGHWMLDLQRLNRDLLEEAGVAKVHLSNHCTSCNRDLFFSYRGQSGVCGRMASLIGLKRTGSV